MIKSPEDITTRDEIFAFINNCIAHNVRIDSARRIGTHYAMCRLLHLLTLDAVVARGSGDARQTLLHIASTAIAAVEADIQRHAKAVDEVLRCERDGVSDEGALLGATPACTKWFGVLANIEREAGTQEHFRFDCPHCAKRIGLEWVQEEDAVALALAKTKEEDDAKAGGLRAEATYSVE